MGRGGRRAGAGRKPNYLAPITMLALTPRDPRLSRLSPDELRTLEAIARKLALDTPHNQTESNTAIEAASDTPRPQIEPQAPAVPSVPLSHPYPC
jgi:hypothetical protein